MRKSILYISMFDVVLHGGAEMAYNCPECKGETLSLRYATAKVCLECGMIFEKEALY